VDNPKGYGPYGRDLLLDGSGSYPAVDSMLAVFIFRLSMPEI